MGRRISYRSGPSADEIAAMRRAREDDLYQRGARLFSWVVIVSLLLTAGLWYFVGDRLEWWQLYCLPPLLVAVILSGLVRLTRWVRVLGL